MLDCLNRQFTVWSILQRMNRLSYPLSNRCLHMSFETVYKMWVQHRGNQSALNVCYQSYERQLSTDRFL